MEGVWLCMCVVRMNNCKLRELGMNTVFGGSWQQEPQISKKTFFLKLETLFLSLFLQSKERWHGSCTMSLPHCLALTLKVLHPRPIPAWALQGQRNAPPGILLVVDGDAVDRLAEFSYIKQGLPRGMQRRRQAVSGRGNPHQATVFLGHVDSRLPWMVLVMGCHAVS